MRLSLDGPDDLTRGLGQRIKARRLARNMTQTALAERAGVSLPSLKRMENAGKGSVELIARIALILRAEDGFAALFAATAPSSLDDVIAPPSRRRASPLTTTGRKE